MLSACVLKHSQAKGQEDSGQRSASLPVFRWGLLEVLEGNKEGVKKKISVTKAYGKMSNKPRHVDRCQNSKS